MEGEDSEKAAGCLGYWDRFDDRFVRPYLIYKFDRLKNMPELEVGDMLKEFEAMQDDIGDYSVSRAESMVGKSPALQRKESANIILASYLQRKALNLPANDRTV